MGNEEETNTWTALVNRNTPSTEPPGELVLDCERESNNRLFKSKWESYYILSMLTTEGETTSVLYSCILGDGAARVAESSDR